MIEIAAGLLLALLVSLFVRWMVAARGRAHDRRRDYRRRFFDLAEQVAARPQSDPSLLAEIRILSGMLDGAAAFAAASRLLRETERDIRAGVAPPRRDRPPAQTCDATTLVYLAIMALSYDRWIAGSLLRARLALLLDPSAAERAGLLLDQHVVHA